MSQPQALAVGLHAASTTASASTPAAQRTAPADFGSDDEGDKKDECVHVDGCEVDRYSITVSSLS